MKLKSQNKYRRLQKPFIFILSIILTLSICSLECFKMSYKADTYYKGYTTQYGSYSLVETNLFGNTRVQSLFMYAFNGVYNGRIRIYYTQASYNGTDSILPINCTIESRSDSYLQVTFKNVSEICIIFQNANLNPIDITSVQYPGDNPMTKITNGTNNQLETIETILYSIQSNVQTINTNVSDIETAVNTGNGYLNTQNSTLNTINTRVNSILTEIQNYFTDSNGVTINIGDVILQFNEFNANLQLQLGLLTNLKTICENILQSINNIDNLIDKITWVDMDTNLILTPSSNTNWSNIANNKLTVTFSNNMAVSDYTNVIYKIVLPIKCTNMINGIDVVFKNGNDVVIDNVLYYYFNNYQTVIYISSKLDNGSNNKIIVTPHSTGDLIYTRISDVPATIKYISDNDIEYWNLYNTFMNYKYHNELVNAINNINMSVTNTTLYDTQVNINNYNDIMTDIENIEVEFNTKFNTNSNNIEQQDINPPNLSVFGQEKLVLTKVTNELLMDNSKIKYIVYIILLGLVVIRILG